MSRRGMIGAKGVWVLLGAMVLTGCGNEGPDLQETARRPVSFGSYTEQVQTRAEVIQAIPDGESMGVYAYYHDESRWTTDAANNTPNFMWNQQATFDAAFNAFVYSPLKYWPNEENDKVSFIAYYPYSNGAANDGTANDVESTGVTPNLANNGKGLPTFSFTVKDDADDQVDLLVSDLIVDLPKSRDTETDPGTAFNDLTIYDKVKFVFHHALAKVEFRITASPDIVRDIASFRLTEPVKVSNLYKDGTLTTSYSASTTTLAWDSHSIKKTDGGGYSFKTYEPQLLMPQDIGNDVKLSFAYEISFKSDSTSYSYDAYGTPVPLQAYTYSSDYTGDASLQLNTMCKTGTSTPITVWEPNHHYIYNIRLTARRIEFTGQVVAWGEEEEWDGNIDQIAN